MTRDVATAQRDVLAALNALGLTPAPDSVDPLRRVDFKKLQQIHDHEEKFLFTTLVASIVMAHNERVAREGGPPTVTREDVREGMLKLGRAVPQASDDQIATARKGLVLEPPAVIATVTCPCARK